MNDEITIPDFDLRRSIPTPKLAPVPSINPTRGLVDLEIEAEVVRACLQRPGFAQRLLDRIPDDIFTNEIHGWVVRQLRMLMRQSRGHMKRVPKAVLQNLVAREEDDAKRGIYSMAVDNLYSKPVEYEAYAEKAIREYAAFQAISSGMRESLSQRRNFDVQRVMETLTGSMRKAQHVLSDTPVYDYAANWKDREANRKSALEFAGVNVLVRTGIPDLDAQIKFTPGTVTGFIAPFKRYKSIMLNHLGFAALLQGYNVVHVTLENTVQMTADRYDARFSGLSMDTIEKYARSEKDMEQFRRVLSQLDSWPQRLKIFEGTAKVSTVTQFESEVEMLEETQGFSADLVVLDYGNIFKPSIVERDAKDYRQQEQIVWDMQHLAKKGSRPRVVVTAFQGNRESLKEKNMKQEQIGQSLGIAQAIDASVAINQEDLERQQGIIRLSPMFIRYGPIKNSDVTLNSDLARMCMDTKADALWGEAVSWCE